MKIMRKRYLNRLIARKHNGMAKVITGIRRSGKSYLLFRLFTEHLIQSEIKKDHIIGIALDSIENNELHDAHKLYKYIKERLINDGSYNYIILDEIQLVNGFELLINSLLRIDFVDIYITGSNSRFLSSDIITEFRGRGDEIRVRPLSFSEFLEGYEGDRYNALNEYMTYGGLPEILNMKDDESKSAYLKNIMDTVYLLDIKERNDIRMPYALDNIVNVLSSSIGSLVNATKLKNTMISSGYKAVDEDTVVRYIGFLEDSFLFEKSRRYDVKGRKYINSTEKYYSADHGLVNRRLEFRQLDDKPHIMENIIYNELRSRGFSVDVGSISCREPDGSKTLEVDFVAKKGNRMYYIQSAYHMYDESKTKQELNPLLKIKDSFRKIVIVMDSITAHMDDNGVMHIGLIEFLTDEKYTDF